MTGQPTSVWIVTSGDYSDYRIRAVFSTEQKAKAWAALIDGSPVDVDEYKVDDPALGRAKRWWTRVRVSADGTTEEVWEPQEEEPDEELGAQVRIAGPSDKALVIDVTAETRERCVKVLSEQVAMAIADFEVIHARLSAEYRAKFG